MLAEERRSRIQDLLAQKSSVTISELAGSFGTSEMTIRRDLDELSARGVCQRTHGGAISLRVQQYRGDTYSPYLLREQAQAREKVAIGRAAAGLVAPGETIALDSGTTAAYMANALRGRPSFTVITNSLRVMDQLYDVARATLISPGGTLAMDGVGVPGGDIGFVGPIAVSTLRRFRVSKAFITASGVTVEDGVSNAGLFQAEIKRTLIEIADEAILITDHTKIGRLEGFVVTGIGAFRRVITDAGARPEDVRRLRELGIEVTLVEPAAEAPLLRSPLVAMPADA
jgi:DeoR/GlpR family transcriptional regulator of sugar metabolism